MTPLAVALWPDDLVAVFFANGRCTFEIVFSEGHLLAARRQLTAGPAAGTASAARRAAQAMKELP